MSETMNDGTHPENGFLSLAALAGADTSEFAVLLSRLPAAGVFRVRCEAIEAKEGESKDGKAPPINFFFKHKCISVYGTIDKTIDPETLVGKTIPDRFTIWTGTAAEVAESVGLLKGRYATVGLPYGEPGQPMGGDGNTTGWVDGAINAEFDIRIRHVTPADGNTRVYIDWLKPEQAAKLAGA